jgi:hypothetical protein
MRWGFFLYSPNQCGSSPILRVSTATQPSLSASLSLLFCSLFSKKFQSII